MANKKKGNPDFSSLNPGPLSSDIFGANTTPFGQVPDSTEENAANLGNLPGTLYEGVLGSLLPGDATVPNPLGLPQHGLLSQLLNDFSLDKPDVSDSTLNLITLNEKGVPNNPPGNFPMEFYNNRYNSITAEIEALEAIKNSINANYVNREDYDKLIVRIQYLEQEKTELVDTIKSMGKALNMFSIFNDRAQYEEKSTPTLTALTDFKLSLKKILGKANFDLFFEEVSTRINVLSPLYNTFIVLRARYSTLKGEKDEGTLSSDDFSIQMNKILLALVNKVDEIMEPDLIKA